MTNDPRFIGYNAHRLQREPDENVFAKQWEKENTHSKTSTLSYLLYRHKDQQCPVEPTVDEYRLAATVIQWLGSPVGQSFLEECGYVKKEGF